NRATFVAKPGGIRGPIAPRGAQCLGKHDGDPIKYFGFWSAHCVDGYGTQCAVPKKQGHHQHDEQQRGTARVAYAQRSVREISECGSNGCRGNDGGPVKEWMKPPGHDLRKHGSEEDDGKNGRAYEIA